MSIRTLAAAAVVFSSSIAAADELAIASVCAEIDETRDTQPPAERAVAREQLARALQDADVLVVDAGCTERYALSHERTPDGEPLVRIHGPAGARRIRNPDRDALPAIYSRMVLALLEAQEEREKAAVVETQAVETQSADTLEVQEESVTTETSAATSTQPEHIDTVESDTALAIRTDAVWYLQLLAGNYGRGVGFGVRVPVTDSGALDFAATFTGGSNTDMAAIGAKYLHHVSPLSSSSAYVGGGLSLASHTVEYMTGSGLRVDVTGGYALSRSRHTRMFIQADVSFLVADEASPSALISFGFGR